MVPPEIVRVQGDQSIRLVFVGAFTLLDDDFFLYCGVGTVRQQIKDSVDSEPGACLVR
jgi:hypothetical protein